MKNQSILFKDKNDLIDKTTIANLGSVQRIINQANSLDQAVLPWDSYCTALAKATIEKFYENYNDYKIDRMKIIFFAVLLYLPLEFLFVLNLVSRVCILFLFMSTIIYFNATVAVKFMRTTSVLIKEFSLMTVMCYDNIYSVKEYKDKLYELSKDDEIKNKLILQKGLCDYNFKKMGNTIALILEDKEKQILDFIIYNQQQYCDLLLSQYNTTMFLHKNYDQLFKDTLPSNKPTDKNF